MLVYKLTNFEEKIILDNLKWSISQLSFFLEKIKVKLYLKLKGAILSPFLNIVTTILNFILKISVKLVNIFLEYFNHNFIYLFMT